ncbi:MAG: DUF1015 domain-containing protein [Thermotogae bacterium]|nr:DUF1015 domain-containing protein [Thermotogota bacterium]
MRPPEVFLSLEDFAVPYEDLWAFLHSSGRHLQKLHLRHIGQTYLLIEQDFWLDGKWMHRRSLLCMVDKGRYRIYPHEDTFDEGVAFYRKLSSEFPYQFAPIMLIGEDREEVLKRAQKGDLLYKGSFYGVEIRIFTAQVEGDLPHEMVIADGHHRFAGYGDEIFAAFMDVRDPALRILPTHRGVKIGIAELKEILKNRRITPKPLRGFHLHYLRRFPVLLRFIHGRTVGLNFEVENDPLCSVPTYMSDHILLAGDIQRIVGYERYPESAFKRLQNGEYDLVLFVKATTPTQVLKVAKSGLRMPRKSTDFFPKLIAGPIFVR